MTEGFANQAIQAVLNSQQAYCKFLSANDSGATGGHQSGILVSKSAKDMMFSQALENENILKRTVDIQWQNDIWTAPARERLSARVKSPSPSPAQVP